MSPIRFEIEKKIPNSLGRAGRLSTPHGDILTPAFVAVGTKGTVKSLTPEEIREAGSQVVLANTYHLYLQPGDKIIKEAGGLHKFMNWGGPTFTDSGGFQAFSLGVAYGNGIGKFIAANEPDQEIMERLKEENKPARLDNESVSGGEKLAERKSKVTEEGVEFVSVLDGSKHFMSPEDSIRIQNDIGADMIFALDEFTSPHADHAKIKATIERTERWAKRCLEAHKKGLTPDPSPKERGDRFGWDTAIKLKFRNLQEQALLFRKNPTEAEKILWERLRGNFNGLHFRRQHVVGHFIVDFVCLANGLVIEVDGDIHDDQVERDQERTNFLEQSGFKVVRFRNEEVLNNVDVVIKQIIGIFKALPLGEGLGGASSQALFGIVQGGRHEDLRKQSAKSIGNMDFDGFGIGGTFVKEDMATAVHWVNEVLPEEKPRHLLGVGEPVDLILGVEEGCDTFDCVAPTRIARNGTLYTRNGKINITNAKYSNFFEPIEKGCGCYTCKNYTCAYVSHLFRAKEMLAATLASIHNLYFLNNLMTEIRQSILDGKFTELKEEFLGKYKS